VRAGAAGAGCNEAKRSFPVWKSSCKESTRRGRWLAKTQVITCKLLEVEVPFGSGTDKKDIYRFLTPFSPLLAHLLSR